MFQYIYHHLPTRLIKNHLMPHYFFPLTPWLGCFTFHLYPRFSFLFFIATTYDFTTTSACTSAKTSSFAVNCSLSSTFDSVVDSFCAFLYSVYSWFTIGFYVIITIVIACLSFSTYSNFFVFFTSFASHPNFTSAVTWIESF